MNLDIKLNYLYHFEKVTLVEIFQLIRINLEQKSDNNIPKK